METGLQQYQMDFIDFLVSSEALAFGDFTLKSGRKAPYFINTGKFESGAHIAKLGSFYAARVAQFGLDKVDVVFGPAYKGIPLAVTTAMALYLNHGKTVTFAFDRKEAKDHGDAGKVVGHKLRDGEKVLIVEDVITAGTTLREVVPLLRELAAVEIAGVLISVNRCEKGTGNLSAAQEAEQSLGVPVIEIVTIHQMVEYLSRENKSGVKLSAEQQQRIAAYLKEYGA
jgi:orotate phosphoribosyltransferase